LISNCTNKSVIIFADLLTWLWFLILLDSSFTFSKQSPFAFSSPPLQHSQLLGIRKSPSITAIPAVDSGQDHSVYPLAPPEPSQIYCVGNYILLVRRKWELSLHAADIMQRFILLATLWSSYNGTFAVCLEYNKYAN